MQNHFRLDDLLARDVVPQWFEGVALVQLVCRQLREQGLEKSGFPGPEHILIATGGSVAITGGLDERPVEAAAHVLGLMLGNDVPVRLRLTMSQATATDGGYANLVEFSEALAYFERPNPEAIVESFRQRAIAAARREIAPARIETPPVKEKQSARAPAPAPSRLGRLAVIAATFSALVCASIWLIGHKVTDAQTSKAVNAEAAESTETARHPGAIGVTAPTTVPRRKSSSNAVPTIRSAENRGPAIRLALEPTPELRVFATTLSYAYPESLPPTATLTFPASTQTGLVTSNTVVGVDPAEKTSDRVYSQADPQVTLPVSVYPKLPSDPPGAPVAGRTLLELTIAADGLVERVKMLTAPRNIHEFMLLSAAKAWRFEPARLGGQPVRYRQTLTLTSMP